MKNLLKICVAATLLTSACAKSTPTSTPTPDANNIKSPTIDAAPTGEKTVQTEPAIIYEIEDKKVTEAEFNAVLATLDVDAEPFMTGSLENPDSSYGGWEAQYHAKDPKTGQKYQIFETQSGPHHSKSLTTLK